MDGNPALAWPFNVVESPIVEEAAQSWDNGLTLGEELLHQIRRQRLLTFV